MKKTILTFVLGISIVFSGTVIAQTGEKKQDAKPVLKEQVKSEQKVAPKSENAPQMQAKPQDRPAPKKMSPEERAKVATERISEKVKDLSAEQKTKITALHVDSYKKLEADRETLKGDKEKMKEASKANFEKLRDGIKGILTPDQFKVYMQPPAKKEGQGAPQGIEKPKPNQEAKPKTEVKNK